MTTDLNTIIHKKTPNMKILRINTIMVARVSIPVSFDSFLDCCRTTELDFIPSDQNMTTKKVKFFVDRGINCLHLKSFHLLTLYLSYGNIPSACAMPLTSQKLKRKLLKCIFMYSMTDFVLGEVKQTF